MIGQYWGHEMMGEYWGHMWFGWLFWIVIAGLIIWAVIALARKGSGGNQLVKPQETALDILKRRYAQGEISKTEFEEKKKDLQS